MAEREPETGREGEFNPYAQPTRHVRVEPETGRKKGCRRWGCGCLALFVVGLGLAIQLPSFFAYRERQAWQEVPAELLRGPCDDRRDSTFHAAVVGEATYAGFSPVYGCANHKAYHRLAKIELRHYRRVRAAGAVEAGREDRERFKRQFDDYAAKGECRAMPAGAMGDVADCRYFEYYAPYAAKVRLEGEDAAWWVPCSGLKVP